MIDWDYERSRCWFPGSSEAAPADLPAEERETPVDWVEQRLRAEWWSGHGCPFHVLYGDDGEMQCHACRKDFKRDSMQSLREHIDMKRLMRATALPAEDRAVTAPPVPPPADARWFPDPPPGPSRAVTAPQEPETIQELKVGAELLAAEKRGMLDFLSGQPKDLPRDWPAGEAKDSQLGFHWTLGYEWAQDSEMFKLMVGRADRSANRSQETSNKLTELQERFSALTHAIEALREEFFRRGDSHTAFKLAAILKSTKQEI